MSNTNVEHYQKYLKYKKKYYQIAGAKNKAKFFDTLPPKSDFINNLIEGDLVIIQRKKENETHTMIGVFKKLKDNSRILVELLHNGSKWTIPQSYIVPANFYQKDRKIREKQIANIKNYPAYVGNFIKEFKKKYPNAEKIFWNDQQIHGFGGNRFLYSEDNYGGEDNYGDGLQIKYSWSSEKSQKNKIKVTFAEAPMSREMYEAIGAEEVEGGDQNGYLIFEKIADFEGTITITLFVENEYFDGDDDDDKYLFKETYNFSM